jgi:uncharacterized repeat protein (TIGR01451 family)
MQYLNMRKAIGLILALAFFVGGTQTALAVGTASGVTISNTATVDYDVAGDNRSASSVAVDFVVDNRVDLTVANQDGNNVNVTPGSTDQVLTYTVTNTGNTTQGYLLTTAIPTANIPMGSVEIYIEDGTTPGFQIGEDTLYVGGTNAGDLDPNGVIGTDDVMTVYVVADTPAAAVDGNQDDVRLVAQTTNAGTATVTAASGTPTAGVDVVFADGAGPSDADNDGQHSDAATYTVVSAALTAAKVIANVNDEFGTGYSIPGAVVRYQITITNGGTGAVDADTVVVSDPIPANTKLCFAAGTRCTAADLPTFAAGTSGLTGVAFEYSDDNGATWTYSPTADAEGADTAVTDVRLAPTGSMVSTGAFTITFGVVVE